MKKFLAFALAVMTLFGVAACGKKKETYTLTFETDGGTQIAAITADRSWNWCL